MFVLKILALSLCIGVSSVFGEESENVQRSSYKFNHPPQSEISQSIPVAIVYDEPDKGITKYAENTVTTYHPRFRKLETVTDPSKYEEESSTTDGNVFPVEEEKQGKRLQKILRKARLRLRSRIGQDDTSEKNQSVQKISENIGVAGTETSNKVYQEFEQDKQRETTITQFLQAETATTIDVNESTTTQQPNTKQSFNSAFKQSTESVTTQREKISDTGKESIFPESLQENSQGNLRKQRVRLRAETNALSTAFTEETTTEVFKVKQTSRKPSQGRGSIKYRSFNDEKSTTTQKASTNRPSTTQEVDEEENYPKLHPNFNNLKANIPIDVTTSRYVFTLERENYPSSEQPKLTNNRPGPSRLKSHVHNGDELIEKDTVETNNRRLQANRRGQSYSHSLRNTETNNSELNQPDKNPSKTPENLTKTPEENNYSKLSIESLQPKPNERKTTVPSFIATTTDEENYPKLPIVPINQPPQQIKTKERKASFITTTILPFTVTEEENYPKLPSVPIKQQKLKNIDNKAFVSTYTTEIYPTLLTIPIPQQKLITTSKEENYPKLPVVQRINEIERSVHTTPMSITGEALTGHHSAKTTEVNHLSQGDIKNIQIGSTRQAENYFSTQAFQKAVQEEIQSETPVLSDVDGRLITLKSSFDVATLSPIAKSVPQNNKKGKVIYRVQKADTLTDGTNETTTQQTFFEEIIPTTEIIALTENTNSKENEVKSKQESKRRNQNHNEYQIPVVIVYDNTDTSLPVNQRKILRTKINPVKNDELIKEVKEPVKEVKIEKSPKEGNITGNVNAENRARGRKPVVPIIESENHVYAQTGKFNYRYESGDGTNAFQEGFLKPFEDDVTGEAVKGGFSYTDKDGNDFSLSYTADENGYRPAGAHLPTPPPIPPAIARALAHLATKTVLDPDEVTESLPIDE